MITIKYASREQHKLPQAKCYQYMHKPQYTHYNQLWKIFVSNCLIEQFKI